MKFRNNIISFAALGLLIAASTGCSSNLTGKVNGEVVRVAIDRDRKTTTKRSSSNKKRKKTTTSIETEIDYRYQVDGRSYDGFSEKDGDVQNEFRTGSQVVICYNPKDPGESDVFPAGSNCD